MDIKIMKLQNYLIIILLGILGSVAVVEAHSNKSEKPASYAAKLAYAPTPLPERIILTWSDDPSSTQSVTWRTDTSVKKAMAQIAVADANGRTMKTERVIAQTTPFESNLNQAHYHSLTFRNLQPDTLYAYRVGDGVNWSEYFHFRTAKDYPSPFSFIYFGDAQNDIKTHWSRVFREAFRDAPRAAFTLHAGDLVSDAASDAQWGEWHGAPAWVNGTVPVIATAGNHEYYRANQGPANERFWRTKNGKKIAIDAEVIEAKAADGSELYKVTVKAANGRSAYLEYNDDEEITLVGEGVEALTGFTAEELLGTAYDKPPLDDRLRDRGVRTLSEHWRHQFAFPVQNVPEVLGETTYYIDYQGVRIISLNSNDAQKAQIPWLRTVLQNNPNQWTILTFHHPIFSPAVERDNPELRELWKPVFDEFKVDLVLNGHDHAYARTGDVGDIAKSAHVPSGYQQAYDPKIGTVYVVSVSGPKMYDVTKATYAKRVAEKMQLYQIIEIDGATLKYSAYTTTGELYDAFMLEKRKGKPNLLREIFPAAKGTSQ